MPSVTLRVVDGADRGRVYEQLETPITIGREEGNTIQLNDERVSRYHIKIQLDKEKLVLTDLESTNGTKVNGEDIQLRILRYGDMISLGRSVLVFGTRNQIATRLAQLRGADATGEDGTLGVDNLTYNSGAGALDFELNWGDDSQIQATLHTFEPPELPEELSVSQAAQLSELIEYIHIRLRRLLDTAHVNDKTQKVSLDYRQWQNLLDLQSRLSEYLRRAGDPDGM